MASLPIRFPSGELLDIDFFVTPLDSSCHAVLGYNFLHRYNPLVDWSRGKLSFREHADIRNHSQTSSDNNFGLPNIDSSTEHLATRLATLPDSAIQSPDSFPNHQAKEKFSAEPIYTYPSVLQMASRIKDVDKIDIAFLKAVAFMRFCKENNSEPLIIHAVRTEIAGRATSTTTSPVDLTSVPSAYHNYADVFNKVRADTLPEHRPYDIKIELEPGSEPPLDASYRYCLANSKHFATFLTKTSQQDLFNHQPLHMALLFYSLQRKMGNCDYV